MRKRHIAAVLAGTMAAVLVAGCGQTAAETEASLDGLESVEEESTEAEGTVSLTVWGAEEDEALLTQIVEEFKEEHAGEANFDITIAGVSESECKDQILGDIQAGPDVFTFVDDQLMSLAAAGVLKPVENADQIKAANSEGSIEAASVDDVLYAYPLTADNGYFMFYNKEFFTEEDVQTLDGMLAVASAAGKKVTMDWSSGWYLYSFFGNTGMELGLNDDGISNYCTWNAKDGAIKGVDVASAMLAIAANPGFLNANDDGLSAGAADGSVIAGVSGIWETSALKEVWGDNCAAVKLPTYTCGDSQVQMSSFAGYKMVGVNAYSDHTDWAAKLADWITNEKNQNLRFELREQGPSNINAAASEAVQSLPTLQALLAQSEYASLQRIGSSYWDPVAEFGAVMAGGNPTGADLQELLDTMVAGVTASNAQ